MVRQGKVGAMTAGAVAIAMASTAHAPKLVTPVPADRAAPSQLPAHDVARATAGEPTPWPSMFPPTDDRFDDEPTVASPRRRPTPRLHPLTPAVREAMPNDPTVASATPSRLPGPIDIEPDPYFAPPGPGEDLPTPVIEAFFPKQLDAPQDVVPQPPTLSSAVPSFNLFPGGTDPINLGPKPPVEPTVDTPITGVAAVPEPSFSAFTLVAPLLLGRRSQR